jgi:hypothetical protein
MDYVKVINPGSTYTSLAGDHQDPEFWGAHITNRVLPIRDRAYRVLKELDHPINSSVRLMVIMDNSYTAFIIGIDGIEESTESEFYSYGVYEESPQPEPIKVKQQKPIRPITVKAKSEYQVGDIILIIDRGNPHYGKKLRVTDPNYRGYEVVTSRNATGTDKTLGFQIGEFEIYIPEPELLPDDKPKFSTNELLEVLNQLNKTPEEIILDLMDHITN